VMMVLVITFLVLLIPVLIVRNSLEEAAGVGMGIGLIVSPSTTLSALAARGGVLSSHCGLACFAQRTIACDPEAVTDERSRES
jgi:hypothetical protein